MKTIKKVHGPYLRKDGRMHVVVIYEGDTRLTPNRRTVSYPKYLMEQHLGRELDPVLETVDHKDRDFTNNNLDNLQVLTLSEHATLDARRSKQVQVKCVWCDTTFWRTATSINNSAQKQKTGPFCSRKCSGEYGAELQNRRQEPLAPQQEIEPQYFTNKD